MLVSAVTSIKPFALKLLLVTAWSPSAIALQFLYISLARKLRINQQLLPPSLLPSPLLSQISYTVSLRVGSVFVIVGLLVLSVVTIVQLSLTIAF